MSHQRPLETESKRGKYDGKSWSENGSDILKSKAAQAFMVECNSDLRKGRGKDECGRYWKKD
jgi:hypothetical protein